MDSGRLIGWLAVTMLLAITMSGHAAAAEPARTPTPRASGKQTAEAAKEAAGRTSVAAAKDAAKADNSDQEKEDDLKGPSVFVPADRGVLRKLDQAKLLLQQERYAEAVRCLGSILDSSEDYFFKTNKAGPVHHSLKSEAQRLLGQMPRAGSELYELQFGARARQMLNEAMTSGDVVKLTEVSRRFFHTRAGYEATLLLGLDHLDHGRWLAGALTLQRLRDTSSIANQFEPTLSLAIATCWLRSGAEDRAREALVELKLHQPGGKISLGGRELAFFGPPAEAVDWLKKAVGSRTTEEVASSDNWAMLRGNVSRTAERSASGPLLSLRWRVPATDHPYLEALIKQMQETDQERDEWTVPGLHPLVVDDVVLMRTAQTLLAVDFNSGKRIWEVPVDDPFEPLLNPPPDTPFQRGPQLEQGLRFRMWGDATYGTLSSNGKYVYAIEDLDLDVGPASMRGMFFRAGKDNDDKGPKPYNRLAAYDIHTGKLKWHIGGSPEEYGLPQAGAFFLGPPLPLMDQLYAIAEIQGEIRLMALDAKTGGMSWSQQLADVDRDILNDPLRRLSGVSPSYGDGILVCPTSNRSVVALELATRSLLWGYTYTQEGDANQQAMLFAMHGMVDPSPAGRWTDSSVIISGGRVLVTPPESNELHCLNLIDGALLWKQARQDDLYLACVHDDKVVLVGQQKVRALNLADGHPAWTEQEIPFPAGSKPSGTGFLCGDIYQLPLSSAEVLAISVNEGRIDSLSKSRRGSVPGNLVCYKGMVVSQRADALEVFYQLDALKRLVDQRLAGAPNDPAATSLRGEIFWHQGKIDEAIASFRRSLELADDPNTRDLLRDAYFDGLQTNFAAHRGRVAEIEPLLESSSQRATFLRLLAAGLEKSGEYPAALEHYANLIDLDRSGHGMEVVDKALSIRRDRWIQAHLEALRQTASTEVRSAIDRLAETRFKAAQKEGTPEAVEEFLNYFSGHPLAGEARRQLIRQLRNSGRMLEAEFLLRRQERSTDPSQVAAAAAELADMFRQAGRPRDAAACYARLAGDLANVPCAEGKTGRELVATIPADDPVRRWLQPPEWPKTRVDVVRSTPKTMPPMGYVPCSLEYAGPRGPFFSDVTIELHHNPTQLLARDGFGDVLWQLGMSEVVGQDRFAFSRGMMRVTTRGHLMLVSMGNKLLAADTLGAGGNKPPRILWSHDVKAAANETAGPTQQMRVVMANMAGAMQRFQFSEGLDAPINMPEAVSEQLLCLRQRHRCVALDPLTGQTLWQRSDIRPDSAVFGDQDYLFVVAAGETKAKVLRAMDGEVLGQREVPMERLATFGRRILVWRDDGDQGVLEMIDAWTGKPVWPAKKMPPNVQVRLVEDEAVAMFEPGGRLLLVRLDDGHSIVDTKVEPEAQISELLVLRSPGQYLVITQGPENDQSDGRHTHAIPGTTSQRITKAKVYAFDDQGKPLWASPTPIDDQFLPLDQPSRLPVLLFAAMIQERRNEGRQIQTSTVIQGIDRRTGQIVCDEKSANGTNGFTLVGDPEKKTVDIRLQRDTLTLTFTNQPPKPSQAIWRAIRKAITTPGRSSRSDRPVPDQPQPADRAQPKEKD
jgi:outer membrane protein assembly factor BamB